MFNLFKKKTKLEKESERIDRERAENIRHQAELDERLKLAEEHGKYDAQKKYGKFKQPGGGSIFGKLIAITANTGKTLQKIDTKKVKKRIDKMSKELEDF